MTDDMTDVRTIGTERVAAEPAEVSGEAPMEAPQPLTADEAIAAAAAEGLVLARKDGTPFGFWGVSKNGHKFKAQVRGLPGAGAKSKSNPISLGTTFACPEEAALALARKYPTAAARLVEMQMEAVKSAKAAVGMTADEAIAAAAAEGLVLARKDGTPFGFWGVSKSGHKFKAQVCGLPGAGAKSKSKPISLGNTFACPEEAALALARKYPTAAARLVEMQMEAVKSAKAAVGMTEEEVRQAAQSEGLTLPVNSVAASGFHGVSKRPDLKARPYRAQLQGSRYSRLGSGGDLGSFTSAHEAALAIARKLGPERSAGLAKPRRNGWELVEHRELSSSEATRIAGEESLCLRRKHNSDDYWGVSLRPSPGTSASLPSWDARLFVGCGRVRRYNVGCGRGRKYKAPGEGVRDIPDAAASSGSSSQQSSMPGRSHSGDRQLELQSIRKKLNTARRTSGALYLGSHASAEAAALTIARALRDDSELMTIVTQLQTRAKTTQGPPASYVAGKRKRGMLSDEEESGESDDDSCDDDIDEGICDGECYDHHIVDAVAVECWSDDDEDGAPRVEVQVI